MTWIGLGEKPHTCPTPGWWARRRAGALDGARWECDCGRAWTWSADSGWYGSAALGVAGWVPGPTRLTDLHGRTWDVSPAPKVYDVPIFDEDGNPQPPPPVPA